MAKQLNGINDGYRGAVGTVIGYEWRGKWCLRSRPRRVHNPRTERQQERRSLFGQAAQLAADLLGVLRIGLRHEALKMHRTECNHFISLNNSCFALGGEGVLAVDYEHLVVSQGPVAPVGFNPALPPARARHVEVAFERNPEHRLALGDDRVYLVAWCPALRQSLLSPCAFRSQRRVAIDLPEAWDGQEVHLYGFVEDYAGRTSASTYIGMLSHEVALVAAGGEKKINSTNQKKICTFAPRNDTSDVATYSIHHTVGHIFANGGDVVVT